MIALQHIWNIVAALFMYGVLASRMRHVFDKRNEHVLMAFVVAGIVSIGITFALYEAYPSGLRARFSSTAFTYHTFVVGMVEEGAKFLAFLLAVRSGAGFREPHDGVLQAAVVGLTFGAIENIGYINSFQGVRMFVRPVLTTPGHAMYGAIWGAIFSRAVYANSVGSDPGSRRNALIGIPIVAILHGSYNTAVSEFLLAGVLVDLMGLALAIYLYRQMVELSPYRTFPLAEASQAVDSLRRGLAFNSKSPILNRNMGIYLMHLGKYKRAAEHLRASVPRSKDPRRAQFLAACAEQTFLPGFYAKRALRIAWSRLTDTQREKYLRQLRELVGNRDGICERVDEFIASAFATRRFRNTREIARDHKLSRIERKHRRAGEPVERLVNAMDPDERNRLRRRMPGAG